MVEKKGRTALGRGLRSLISTPVPIETSKENIVPFPMDGVVTPSVPRSAEPQPQATSTSYESEVRYLPIEALINNPNQPRQDFSDREIAELSESIKSLGVIQPVLVRPSKLESSRFEIVAGERRWRAAKSAGLSRVPVIIRELQDKETLEIALVENVQRQNLNPVEEARAYQRLSDEFHLSQQDIATRVGKDRASISNYLRLLKLPEAVIAMIREGSLSMGHAKAILTVREPSLQLNLAKKVLNENLSVRQLESIVAREITLPSTPPSNGSSKAAVLAGDSSESYGELVERLRRTLGTKVLIKHHTSGRGSIVIQYFSDQELGRIVDTVCKE